MSLFLSLSAATTLVQSFVFPTECLLTSFLLLLLLSSNPVYSEQQSKLLKIKNANQILTSAWYPAGYLVIIRMKSKGFPCLGLWLYSLRPHPLFTTHQLHWHSLSSWNRPTSVSARLFSRVLTWLAASHPAGFGLTSPAQRILFWPPWVLFPHSHHYFL